MNNYNYYNSLNNPYMSNNNYDSNNLYGAYEGYLKGNMFKNLYEQYKNFKPNTIELKNEKEQNLFNLNQIGFALHDINLYLDVNPNDQKMLELFTKYKDLYNNLFTQYESKYGALCVNQVNNQIPFEWEKDMFPWEVL